MVDTWNRLIRSSLDWGCWRFGILWDLADITGNIVANKMNVRRYTQIMEIWKNIKSRRKSGFYNRINSISQVI